MTATMNDAREFHAALWCCVYQADAAYIPPIVVEVSDHVDDE